jgi:hypothetical protein
MHATSLVQDQHSAQHMLSLFPGATISNASCFKLSRYLIELFPVLDSAYVAAGGRCNTMKNCAELLTS